MSAELDNLKAAFKAFSDKVTSDATALKAKASEVAGEQSQQAVHSAIVATVGVALKADEAVTSTPAWKWRLYVYGAAGLVLLNVAAILHWGLKWF